MHRTLAIAVLLIQFCVQFIPLAVAEESSSGAIVLPAESGAVLPQPLSDTGTVAVQVQTVSGAIVAATGSTVVVGSGAVAAPVIIALAPPSFPVKVVVTEVMWMGSNVSTADEWVEIAAFSSGSAIMPRSVSGWTIVTVKAGVETTLARLPNVQLASGATIVVANTHAATSRLLSEPAVVTTAMSLPNTQLLLRLKDGSGAIVDDVDDGVGAPMAGANPSGGAKASMERLDPWQRGNVSTNWKTATLSLGFDDGPPIFGTPGMLGPVSVSPVSSPFLSAFSASSASSLSVSSAAPVIVGPAQDGTVTSPCGPGPDLANSGVPLDPQIAIQSSSATAGKLSLNLEARVTAGSMVGAVCAWVYPDGFASSSCNPPVHSMTGPVAGDVILSVKDTCGNTLIRALHVDVAGKLSKKDDAGEGMVCTPLSFTGVVISEVFPNPIGDDTAGEWIELMNPGPDEKPLCGWSVDDGERGSDPYPLDRWQLHPGDRLLLEREETGIALNNDRDAVRLFAPLRQGGSGAYEIVRYEGSPEGQAYARRDDGAWLWTSEETPGEVNIFPDVRWPEQVAVRIVAAMPNPKGNDSDGGEWIELENQTAYPLPLTGWHIETLSEHAALDGLIMAPHQRKRLDTILTLPNTHGFLRLIDRDDIPQSVLAWATAKDDVAVTRPIPMSVTPMTPADPSTACSLLSGISFVDNLLCFDSLLALLKEKKLDLEKYSQAGGSSALFVGGTDVAELLLRQGKALVDDALPTPYIEAYRHAESEAREHKRGIWADDDTEKAIDDARFVASTRSILASEGLIIKASKPSGIIQPGDIILLSANVPASIEVAFGTGAFEPYVGPISIAADTDLSIRATADVQSASGSPISVISFQSYAVLKNRYPTITISEVYPSPGKGESEWIELWNPTDERVPLFGWTVDDIENAGSSPITLGPGLIIEPRSYLTLSGLKVVWNNDGDTVLLLAPNEKLSDSLTYGTVKTAHAVAATVYGACDTVHPTPGAENRCAQAPTKIVKKKTPKSAALKAPGKKVRYRNVVTAFAETAAPRALFGHLKATGSTDVSSIGVTTFWLCIGLFLFCGLWMRVKALR